MTRLIYGGAPADFVVAQGAQAEILTSTEAGSEMFGTAVLLPSDTVALDAFTDAALASPTTDLLDIGGNPIAQVMTLIEFDDRATVPQFQGPDGHTGPLWLSADGTNGFRFEPDSTLLYLRTATAEADLVTAAADITAMEASVTSLDGRLDTLEAVTASPNVQYFTADGTWTKPTGAKRVFAECQGGGGAGGGAATTSGGQASEGSGGGGGGYAAKWFDAADLGATRDIVVGAGGTGSAGADGTDGGFSEVVDEFGADGGSGGNNGTAGTAVITEGAPGGTGYDAGSGIPPIIRSNGLGHPGVVVGGVSLRLNMGGPSDGDGESVLSSATASGAGAAGSNGGGGSGGRNAASQGTARAGGAGGDGYVRVTTFFF